MRYLWHYMVVNRGELSINYAWGGSGGRWRKTVTSAVGGGAVSVFCRAAWDVAEGTIKAGRRRRRAKLVDD
jgi:hypothetical protein